MNEQTPDQNGTAVTDDNAQAQDTDNDSSVSEGSSNYDQTTSEIETTSQPPTNDSEGQDTANASKASADDQTGQADSDKLIRAGHYAFKLPVYWRGKVEVTVSGDDVTIAPMGVSRTVESNGTQYEVTLATITLVTNTQSDEVVAGDIGNHLMYQQGAYQQGVYAGRIELWTTNWPWIAASGTFPATQLTTQELETLVNLSTGGTLTYEDALRLGADSEEVMYAESCYSEITFE